MGTLLGLLAVVALIGANAAFTAGEYGFVAADRSRIGVAAEGTVLVPGAGTPSPDAVKLEPNHTLFLLVPGTRWGDEVQWMMDVAEVIAGRRSSVRA